MECEDRRMEGRKTRRMEEGKKVMDRVGYLVSFCHQAIMWLSMGRVPRTFLDCFWTFIATWRERDTKTCCISLSAIIQV